MYAINIISFFYLFNGRKKIHSREMGTSILYMHNLSIKQGKEVIVLVSHMVFFFQAKL